MEGRSGLVNVLRSAACGAAGASKHGKYRKTNAPMYKNTDRRSRPHQLSSQRVNKQPSRSIVRKQTASPMTSCSQDVRYEWAWFQFLTTPWPMSLAVVLMAPIMAPIIKRQLIYRTMKDDGCTLLSPRVGSGFRDARLQETPNYIIYRHTKHRDTSLPR